MSMTSREMLSHFKQNYPDAIVSDYSPNMNMMGYVMPRGISIRMENGDIIHYFPSGFSMPKKTQEKIFEVNGYGVGKPWI